MAPGETVRRFLALLFLHGQLTLLHLLLLRHLVLSGQICHGFCELSLLSSLLLPLPVLGLIPLRFPQGSFQSSSNLRDPPPRVLHCRIHDLWAALCIIHQPAKLTNLIHRTVQVPRPLCRSNSTDPVFLRLVCKRTERRSSRRSPP